MMTLLDKCDKVQLITLNVFSVAILTQCMPLYATTDIIP